MAKKGPKSTPVASTSPKTKNRLYLGPQTLAQKPIPTATTPRASPMTHRMEPSPPQTRNAPPPPPGHKATPAPNTTPPPKGGGGADDPLVGTKDHVPYPTGVEVGTVTGVHRRKAGSSGWNTQTTPSSTRWPVASSSPPQGVQEHLDRVRKGKGKAPPPPPSLRASLTRRLTPCLTPRLTPPQNPKLTPQLTPKHKTTPLLTPPLTQPNNCGTPKRGLKRCNLQVVPPVVHVVQVLYWHWSQ